MPAANGAGRRSLQRPGSQGRIARQSSQSSGGHHERTDDRSSGWRCRSDRLGRGRGDSGCGPRTGTRRRSVLERDAEVRRQQESACCRPTTGTWVLAGSSLGLSYAEGGAQGGGMQMFNTTLIEPTAYRHFVETGEFRDGTMLVLLLQGIGTNALPARRGQFATDVHGIEMAVKDTSRVPEGLGVLQLRRLDDGRAQDVRGAAAQGQLLQLPHRARRARQRVHAVLPDAARRRSARRT